MAEQSSDRQSHAVSSLLNEAIRLLELTEVVRHLGKHLSILKGPRLFALSGKKYNRSRFHCSLALKSRLRHALSTE